MKPAYFIVATVLFGICCHAQEFTKQERKANSERVKAEQKLLDQKAKDQKKAAFAEARNSPTWAYIEAEPIQLKGALIQHMRAYGYQLDFESDHQISFAKNADGKDAFVATLLAGNAYSGTPVKHVSFVLTPTDNPSVTHLDCAGSVSVRMPFGKVNRIETTNYPAFKVDLLREYKALQSWAGHQKEVAQKN